MALDRVLGRDGATRGVNRQQGARTRGDLPTGQPPFPRLPARAHRGDAGG